MMQKGYTLLELLIVILIIGILVTLTTANFREFSQRQVLKGVQTQIIADLNFARSSAKSGKIPSGCNGTFLGYHFVVTSTTTYRVDAVCSLSRVYGLKNGTIPANVFIRAPSTNPLRFGSVTTLSNFTTNQVIGVCAADNSYPDSGIFISPSGSLSVGNYTCP